VYFVQSSAATGTVFKNSRVVCHSVEKKKDYTVLKEKF
jgi:hypothetical protein